MHIQGWLLLCACCTLSTLLRAANGQKYPPISLRNYNSGARYYMRYAAEKLTFGIGYPYGQFIDSGNMNRAYYYSGYGYRLHKEPQNYKPLPVGTSFYYFPPMFYYYHRLNGLYWNRQKPRYVCRNDYAFWPLENQTGEFVGGRVPALDLREFDKDLPTPNDGTSQTYYNYGYVPSPPPLDSPYLTAYDSLILNQYPKYDFKNYTNAGKTTAAPPMASTKKILVYNYFVCPDGKNPDEINCCGATTAQYCCSTSNKYVTATTASSSMSMRQILPTVFSIIAGVAVTIILIVLRRKGIIRRNGCFTSGRSNHQQTRIITMPNVTVVTGPNATFVAAPTDDSVHLTTVPMSNDGGVTNYNRNYDYQPVAGAPPSYTSIVPVANVPAAPTGVTPTPATVATAILSDGSAPPYSAYASSLSASAPAPPYISQPSVPTYTGVTANWQQQSAPEQAPHGTGTGDAVSCLGNIQPFTSVPSYSYSTGFTGAPNNALSSAPPYGSASYYTAVGSGGNQPISDKENMQ